MFTGIVDHCGRIEEIKEVKGGKAFQLSCHFADLQLGESVAVDGICLTVVDPRPNQMTFELSPETLAVTGAKSYHVGKAVNLERALRMNDRLGGHWVTGHIDTTARLLNVVPAGEYIGMSFGEISPEHQRFLIKKGSVALNGVSLTVNTVETGGFSVMLIPHTLERTNLRELRPGDRVNVELDWMLKVILNETERLYSLTKEPESKNVD